MKEYQEWDMWIYCCTQNKGIPWKSMINISLNADVSSDAWGRTFAGVVKQQVYKIKVNNQEDIANNGHTNARGDKGMTWF